MDSLVELWERPESAELFMIAGWHQWADAGAISSGLPAYLVKHLDARQIGEIHPDEFYLFQIPGTHHFLRPEIKLDEGFREALHHHSNEIYFAGDENRGLVIFMGTEPHMNVDRYAEAFFNLAAELGVKRVGAVGGVYGAMPYDLHRSVSCTYSLRRLKEEMSAYAVRFSNYNGGATIGSYLLDRAEQVDQEYFTFNAFVPAYDFDDDEASFQTIRIDSDYRAWYELMRRFNYMFNLGYDLSELERLSSELDESIDGKIEELVRSMPELKVKEFVHAITEEFTEMPFMPLDDIWTEELGDLFDDSEE